MVLVGGINRSGDCYGSEESLQASPDLRVTRGFLQDRVLKGTQHGEREIGTRFNSGNGSSAPLDKPRGQHTRENVAPRALVDTVGRLVTSEDPLKNGAMIHLSQRRK